MTKNMIARIITIAASVLMLIGVAFLTWMLVTEIYRNNIVVNLSDGKTEVIEFDGLGLIPGESCEYEIKLKGEHSREYSLDLDFVEGESMTLKNFARVSILSGEEVVYDELLANAFANDIVLNVDLKEDKNTSLKIVYYMPIEVGNEAKNAEANFELLLTASNE